MRAMLWAEAAKTRSDEHRAVFITSSPMRSLRFVKLRKQVNVE